MFPQAWRWLIPLVLANAVVGAGACSTARPALSGHSAVATPTTSEPRPGRRAPRWVRAQGTRLIDETAGPLHLAGVVLSNDAWGVWVWPKSDAIAKQGNDPMIRPDVQADWVLTDRDFQQLGELPGNVVRYEINHELFADANGKRDANLTRLRAHIERLAAVGIGVIVDLNMPIGLDGQSDGYERKKPGREREKTFFEDDAFLAATLRLWTLLAARLSDLPTLVGYELVNEPRAPCDADGGIAAYQRKLEKLAAAIRAVDHRHVIFVPEYHSREANPGESYPDPNGGPAMRIDHGEQGVIWDRGLVEVGVDNVAYVFHIYDPWSFTGAGGADFSPSEIEQKVAERVHWRDEVGHAPLFVTEYGVNRLQPVERRVKWLSIVHDCLLTHGIGATFFNYKTGVTPWIGKNAMFALFGQLWERNAFGSGIGADYRLRDDAVEPAAQSGFNALLLAYFQDLGPDALSIMDNAPVLTELQRFAAGAAQPRRR